MSPVARNAEVVGHFNAYHEITVGKEPEVGIAWEAECGSLGLAALGATKIEAVENLLKYVGERGIRGSGGHRLIAEQGDSNGL